MLDFGFNLDEMYDLDAASKADSSAFQAEDAGSTHACGSRSACEAHIDRERRETPPTIIQSENKLLSAAQEAITMKGTVKVRRRGW